MTKSIISILLCLLIASCSYQQIDKVAPAENLVIKGEKFRIVLPEDHTTGAMWQMNNKYDDKVLDYYGSVFHGNEKGVDFNFTAYDRGKTTLNFALIKFRDTLELKQFIVKVK